MAAYATRANLTSLALRATAVTGVSNEEQDAQLEAASRWADTYLRSRYVVPLTGTIDGAVIEAVCDRAAWKILKKRGADMNNPSDAALKEAAAEAKELFQEVHDRKRSIDAEELDGDEGEDEPADAPMVTSNSRRGW